MKDQVVAALSAVKAEEQAVELVFHVVNDLHAVAEACWRTTAFGLQNETSVQLYTPIFWLLYLPPS
ncbi:hypothetical protein OH492_20790 [Vibrio chagasii]|nr:hypothetical protein [Vibrio chagasii]